MIKRSILQDLEKHLIEKEITVLIGSRQVGKTYLMKKLQNGLETKGEKTVFLTLDIENDREFFVSQNSLINYLRLQIGNTKGYVFIDEIQRRENAGLFLKGIYDMQLPYKFIVSGSGSLDLKAKIKESMAGRKQVFIINPVSFDEFVNFKTNYKYENRLQEFFSIEQTKTLSLLAEYMMFGGYPKVVLSETAEKKRSAMDEIYTSYIERDITDLLTVEKPEAFTNLLKILSSQIGGLVNITELSATIGISDKTINHYLWYLEETYIIRKVTPYYRNTRSEITKMPVYYFYDTGLRNYCLGLFGLPQIPIPLSGHLFENVVFNILRVKFESSPTQIHFWRTRDQAEVDFVIETGLDLVPIEVKYAKMQKTDLTRSFRSFLARYKPKKAYMVHLGGKLETKTDSTEIFLVPFYDLIIESKQPPPSE